MTASRWTPLVVWITAAFLALATLVWSSGEDMLVGLMLLVVFGGWGLLGLFGIGSFVQAVRTRSPRWLRRWALVWLGCIAALVSSLAISATGAPEDVRIGVSRSALIDAGENVLSGEHPHRAGLYGFSETRVSDGCALLETGSFALDTFGFTYCPTRAPVGFEDLGGGLYKYAYD